jgi:hypothetical protein
VIWLGLGFGLGLRFGLVLGLGLVLELGLQINIITPELQIRILHLGPLFLNTYIDENYLIILYHRY